jgi:hypothetical protein
MKLTTAKLAMRQPALHCVARRKKTVTTIQNLMSSLTNRSLIPKAALIPDRSQMLIDAKYNEHEFGSDSRHDDAHAGAEHAGDKKDDADEWIISHRRQRTDRAGETEQNRNDDCQPIKDLNHSGRDEPLPLEKITKAEHEATSSRALTGGRLHCAIAAVNRS